MYYDDDDDDKKRKRKNRKKSKLEKYKVEICLILKSKVVENIWLFLYFKEFEEL